ncbi:MAG: helix-hairpin-helix domain-containing protein [Thaumarchaeota archaeon]|nr:helix-hairpin-helix domain-containing protein [Nitrososphaerota archaeon]
MIPPRVVVDERERQSGVPEKLSGLGYDGRLFIQASEISSAYRKPYLLVEGDVKEVSNQVKNLRSYYGAIASVTMAYGLRIIHTADAQETAVALAELLQNSKAGKLPPAAIGAPRKGKELAQQQLYFVSALPGVGLKLAKRLLTRVGTPRKVINLTEAQFAMVPGVGSKRGGKISRMLDSRYFVPKEGAVQEKLGE